MAGDNLPQLAEILLARIVDVREAQKKYFAQRNDYNLRESKRLEKKLDEFIGNMIRSGVHYEEHLDKNEPKQNSLLFRPPGRQFGDDNSG